MKKSQGTSSLSEQDLKIELDRSRRKTLERTIRAYSFESADNWYIFCEFYISATRKLIDSITIPIDDKKSLNEGQAIIIPAYFLFKHTLELVLKCLSVSIKRENKNTHDLSAIIKTITYNNISKKINWQRLSKESNKDEATLRAATKWAVEGLESLAKEYLFHLGLTGKLKNDEFFLVDTENEMFKYPVTSNVRIQLDPFSLYNLPEDVIKSFREDFQKLVYSFNLLSFYLNDNS